MIDILDFIELTKESANYPCSILIISLGNDVDKSQLNCFNTKDFSHILKDTFKEINYNPIRSNIHYINFDEVKNSRDLRMESELKPYLKKLFKKITTEVSDYFILKNIFPKDYENLKTKTIYNYIKYKIKCKTNEYEMPEFLVKTKNEVILEIFKMGFNVKDVENNFKIFPTFDKQYIFNILNLKKINENKEDSNLKIETIDLKCLILKDKLQYINKNNSKKNIDKKNNIKTDEEKKLENEKKFDSKICNVCNQNIINIVFGYCKHKYVCEDCLNFSLIFCPICLKRIKKFIKLYKIN